MDMVSALASAISTPFAPLCSCCPSHPPSPSPFPSTCPVLPPCFTSTIRSTRHIPHLHSMHPPLALSRRASLLLVFCTADVIIVRDLRANAEEPAKSVDNVAKPDDTPVDALLSFFDPNEKTKSGKLLPKSYLKSARQVVKSLRESLKDESNNEASVRRSADAAREAIRDYLQNWRDQTSVSSEDSYKALESVFKILGKFYSKQGPRAMLSSEVKSQVLSNLELAEAAL